MIYLDSSAFVKRYLKEEGTDALTLIISKGKMIATSKLTFPELISAFMRKQRTGEVTKKSLETALETFEADWDKIFVVEFHDELLPKIKLLIGKYPLKGGDAVHLSSALWLQQTVKEKVTFVASDEGLLRAARSEKLTILNPINDEAVDSAEPRL